MREKELATKIEGYSKDMTIYSNSKEYYLSSTPDRAKSKTTSSQNTHHNNTTTNIHHNHAMSNENSFTYRPNTGFINSEKDNIEPTSGSLESKNNNANTTTTNNNNNNNNEMNDSDTTSKQDLERMTFPSLLQSLTLLQKQRQLLDLVDDKTKDRIDYKNILKEKEVEEQMLSATTAKEKLTITSEYTSSMINELYSYYYSSSSTENSSTSTPPSLVDHNGNTLGREEATSSREALVSSSRLESNLDTLSTESQATSVSPIISTTNYSTSTTTASTAGSVTLTSNMNQLNGVLYPPIDSLVAHPLNDQSHQLFIDMNGPADVTCRGIQRDEIFSEPLLVIIRHGKTVHNQLGLFTGWEDAPLAAQVLLRAE
jgi:hypothetical protein